MSIQVSTRVWDDCNQSGDRLLVMLALADYCNDNGRCWPSQTSLAARTRCSERGVQKMIDALIKAGEVELIRAGGGRGRSAEYRLPKYLKGEQGSPNTETKGEQGTGNVKTLKGERGSRKGERGDVKGEQAVPPNHQGTINEPSVEPSEAAGAAKKEEDEDAILGGPKKASVEVDLIVETWNAQSGVSKILLPLTAGRKTHLAARLQETLFRTRAIEGISRVTGSKFCRGGGPRGWKATFDWFIKPGTLTKILEGQYDDETPTKPNDHRKLRDATERERDRTGLEGQAIPTTFL
jgi:hypothetical protein